MIATLRYRCACAAKEVLQISVAFDANTTEEKFMWTMRQMWHDVQFEVEQHIKGAAREVTEKGAPSKSLENFAR